LKDTTLLVSSAGLLLPKTQLEYGEVDDDQYLDLNSATFFITQTFAASLVDQKKS
jgi:hypothetical protein